MTEPLSKSPDTTTGSMNILAVLDDDAIFHQIIDYAHTNANYTHIFHYYNAEQLLTYLAEHKDNAEKIPDVLFVDLNLPIVDGWSFLNSYAEIADSLVKKIMVYVVSTSVRREDPVKAKQYPFVKEYLIKPVSVAKLKNIALQSVDSQ